MAVVAGLFDSQVEATAAMDELLTHRYHDMETRVVGGQNDNTNSAPGAVLPIVPNTGANYGAPGTFAPVGGIFASGDIDWLDRMEEEERGFYYEGLKEGATLALVKVDDEDADQVRRVLSMHGGRTFKKE